MAKAKKKIIVPGDALNILMASKGLNEKTLGSIIKESPQAIKAIIDGKRELTLTQAVKFSSFFETDLSFWFEVQLSYDESKTKTRKPQTVRKARKAKATVKTSSHPKKSRAGRKPKAVDAKPKAARNPRVTKKSPGTPKEESK